jgi:hypothetical protein
MKKLWDFREVLHLDGAAARRSQWSAYVMVLAALLLPLAAGCSVDNGRADVSGAAGQAKLAAYSTSTTGDTAPDLTTTSETPSSEPGTTVTTELGNTTTTEPQSTTTTQPPESTTTTLAPAAAALYEITDWSTGLNGWAAAGQWKTVAGMLVTDGSDSSIAVAPVGLGEQRNYAIECEIQLLYPQSDTAVYLVARLVNGVGCWAGHNAHDRVNTIGYDYQRITEAYFTNDSAWHTYRFEVYDNTLKLFFENAEVVRAMDNRALEPGTVGIFCGSGQINVRAFRVIAL